MGNKNKRTHWYILIVVILTAAIVVQGCVNREQSREERETITNETQVQPTVPVREITLDEDPDDIVLDWDYDWADWDEADLDLEDFWADFDNFEEYLEELREIGLAYYMETYEDDIGDSLVEARIELLGCHVEIHIYVDDVFIVAMVYFDEVIYEL